MNKSMKISKTEIKFSGNSWETIILDENTKIIKPKFMIKNINWKDITQLQNSRVPFVKIIKSNNSIVSIEAQSGIVREVPIFYTVIDESLIISDSPEKLIKNKPAFNELSIQEFLIFGYVTSNRTLFKGIYSLEAGEKLIFNGASFVIDTEYLYNSTDIENKEGYELLSELKDTSEQVFDDLIKSLNGKRAIIPLSAGYDSRFIASMLKLGGFDDVLCYSWGKPGNKDIETSRKIAKQLGYEWCAIDYSEESWSKVISTDWFEPALIESTQFTSISGAASFPFQKFLRENADLHNCVMIPGHTGDFIGGGHIPQTLTEGTSNDEVLKFIKEKHFLIDQGIDETDIGSELAFQLEKYSSRVEKYRTFETWELRERQAKFIVNTNRYYEILGFTWSMPLWDSKFVDFWGKVPLSKKKNLNLYNEFLETKIFKDIKVDFDLKRLGNGQSTNSLKTMLKKNALIRNMIQGVRKKKVRTDEFGFYLSLPNLYKRTMNKYPAGFDAMNMYCDKYKIGKPAKQYSYLSRSVLAMLIEDVK